MKNNGLNSFYLVLIGLLFLPYLQMRFNFFEIKELKGTFEKQIIEVPKIGIKTIKDRTYQTQFEKRVKEKIGFRNLLIRINNQLNYSWFNVANSRGVIVAEDNVLLPEGYIKSYLGVDYVGRERMEGFVKKTKFVQDSLAKRGKQFFFLISPGKSSVYPESIPKHYFYDYPESESNYDALKELFIKYDVNFLDMRSFIVQNKSSFEYAIFPSKGLHWSGNTVAFVMDSMLSYINKDLGVPIRQIELSEGEKTIKDYQYTDYDIGESMNLLWFISKDTLHYPIINYLDPPTKAPVFLGIGDSFLESFFGFYDIFDSTIAKGSRIWFYNRTIDWPQEIRNHSIEVSKLNLEKEIEDKEIVMIQTSDENIRMLGFNFVDDLYDLFTKDQYVPIHLEKEYKRLLEEESVIQEAEDLHGLLGYSRNEMIKSIARHELEKIPMSNFNFDKEVQKYIDQIEGNEEWLENIKKQAIQKNIPIEENIRENAIWMVKEKLGRN